MNVEQILEIFYLGPISELVAFFSVHTLAAYLVVIPIRRSNKCFSQDKNLIDYLLYIIAYNLKQYPKFGDRFNGNC